MLCHVLEDCVLCCAMCNGQGHWSLRRSWPIGHLQVFQAGHESHASWLCVKYGGHSLSTSSDI